MDKPELDPVAWMYEYPTGEKVALLRRYEGETGATETPLYAHPPSDHIHLEPFQRRVDKWMGACFGDVIKNDGLERCDRFIEEDFELVQAVSNAYGLGFNADRAHALVEYVFNRPPGEPNQEVGGVRVTLAALCNVFEIDEHEAAETELARVWTKVDAIRAKQATKPVGSALPVACPTPSTEPEPQRISAEDRDCGIAVEGLGPDEELVEAVAKAVAVPALDSIRGYEHLTPEDIWTYPEYAWVKDTMAQIARAAIPIIRAQCEAEVQELREALIACRDQFDFYAAEHRKAEKHDKAATNERFAFLASQALARSKHRQKGEG